MAEHAAEPRGPTARTPSPAPANALAGRERQRLLTHQRIVAAAIAEFERCGVAQSRIEHICRAAGVSRPTFYAHFPSKEAVVLEVQRVAGNAVAGAIVSRLAEAATLAEVIDSLVDGLFGAAGRLSHRLRREIVSLDVRERRRADWEGTPLFQALQGGIDAARRRGEIDPGLDAAQLTRCILVSLLGFLAGDADDLEPSRADARATLRVLAQGLRVPRGGEA